LRVVNELADRTGKKVMIAFNITGYLDSVYNALTYPSCEARSMRNLSESLSARSAGGSA